MERILLFKRFVGMLGVLFFMPIIVSAQIHYEKTASTSPSSIDSGKTSYDNLPPAPQKKLAIHCKPTVLPSGQGDVVFLGFELSLITPCPTDAGIIKARGTVVGGGSRSGEKTTINLGFRSKGNITLLGEKTYTFSFSNQPVVRDIDLQVIGPGMGSLDARAHEVIDGKDSGGGADSIFFLLANDGEFIVNRSSFFELERAKLTNDLQSGIINKSKYDQEFQKMLDGKHTYVCSHITCDL